MTHDAPTSTRELCSTVLADGTLELEIRESALASPRPDEVVVRIEAAPINPSDLALLLAQAEVGAATNTGEADGPRLRAPIPAAVRVVSAGRVGVTMPVGNEAAGTVVAAGTSPEAQQLLGRTVAFRSGNAYAEHRTLSVAQCLAVPDGVAAPDAASATVNPLTALCMVETCRIEGHQGLLHTAAGSNLGLMLNRICRRDGVPLVNVVRSETAARRLLDEGAAHVCSTAESSFDDELDAALDATGTTLAFDAIGGGSLASQILAGMERVQARRSGTYSVYGTDTPKQVYIYGSLDRGPTVIHRRFGMTWAVGGWLLTPFLRRIGDERTAELRARVLDELTTTFASTYGFTATLDDLLDPQVLARCAAAATGDKPLVVPNG
jgi:NADPH2:quinone reductase